MPIQNPDSLDFSDLLDRIPTSPTSPTGRDPNSLDFSNVLDEAVATVDPPSSLRAEFGRRFDAFRQTQRADREQFYRDTGLGRGAISGIIDMISDTAFDVFESAGHPLNTAKAILSGIGEVPGAVVDMIKDPASLGTSLIEGVVAPFLLYPIELISGTDLWGENLWGDLSPEERYNKGRSVAANAFGLFTGMRAGQMIKAGFAGQEALLGSKTLKGLNKAARSLEPDELATIMKENVHPWDIMKLARTAGKPEFLMRAKAGLAEGLVGGATVGFLEGTDYESRYSAATTLGIIALPLGLAAETLIPIVQHARGVPTLGQRADMIAKTAGVLTQLREQNFVMDQTPMMVGITGAWLTETQSLAAVMARRAIEYIDVPMRSILQTDPAGARSPQTGKEMVRYGRNMSVIPQVTDPSEVLSQLARATGPDYITGIHNRPDGLFDILIAPVSTQPRTIEFFQRTGYSEGQQVGYNGSTRYYIKSAARTGKRTDFDTVTLLPFNGGPEIPNVPINDLSRPTSAVMNDLQAMQSRQVGVDWIIDVNSGSTLDGSNPIGPGGMGADSPAEMHMYVNENFLYQQDKTLRIKNKKAYLYQLDPQGRLDPNTAMELAPGFHNVEATNPDGHGLGVQFYLGGGKVEIDMPQPDGTTKKQEVTIGKPGEVLAYTNWDTKQHPSGEIWRGTKNAALAESKVFNHHDELIAAGVTDVAELERAKKVDAAKRQVVSDAMNKGRPEHGLFMSLSSQSIGAQVSHARRMNKYFPDEIIGRFGYADPEVVKRGLFAGFMDHIGMVGDNIIPDASEHITHVAMTGYDPYSSYRGRPNVAGEATVHGKPGQTLKHLKKQIDPELAKRFESNPTKKHYVTEDGTLLSQAEAMAILSKQNQLGEVPRYIPKDYVPPDAASAEAASKLTFDQLADSFMDKWHIRDEMRPAVKLFLEQEMGRELLGDTERKPHVEKRILAQLYNDWRGAKDALQDPGLTQLEKDEWHHIHDVIEQRIHMMENPEPRGLSLEEYKVFERLTGEAQEIRRDMARNLLNLAHEFGFMPEREGGVIRLRDGESNTLLPVTFINEAEASDWIKNTGHPKGSDLDGGGSNMVPPSGVIGNALPPSNAPQQPWQVPFAFSPDSRVTKMMSLLDSTIPWLTPKRAFLTSIDNAFGTTYMRDVYFPLQTAKMKMEAAKKPHLVPASNIEKSLMDAKIPRSRWATISDYRETMSPQEIVDRLYTTRKLTTMEQEFAQRFVDRKVDTKRVYEFEREYNMLEDKYQIAVEQAQAANASPEAFNQLNDKWIKLEQKLIKDHMMDKAHIDTWSDFIDIREMNPQTTRLDAITRLTRAIQNQEPDRATYAAANNMSPVELKAAAMLDKLYDDAGKALGVDRTISHYMNHYRVTGDFSPAEVKAKTQEHKNEQINSIFASDLMRSGEMSVYERDPIKAYVSYINQGFNNRMFDETWNKAVASMVKETNKIPQGREAALKIVGEYVYGIRGVPASSDQLMQAAVDKMLSSLDTNVSIDVRKDLINTYMAASSGALLGFRVMQGVRDFTGFSKMYYTRFGAGRYAKALNLAFTRDKDGVLPFRKLAEEGTTPGLGIVDFMTDEEMVSGLTGKAGSKFKDMIFKASKVGMDASGQTTAYAVAHAMAYLETRTTAAEWLNKLHSGKVTKQQAYKQLSINSYDIPIIKIFDDLVNDGKFDEATEFLAQTTGGETAFIYGMANHAYGWGTNWGRIGGQFGTYAVWDRNFLGRVAGRGTAGERAAAIARFAAGEVATKLVGRTLGFDMSSWSLLGGALFAGGPMVDQYEQLKAMTGMAGSLRQGFALGQWRIQGGTIPVMSTHIPGGMALADFYKAYTAHTNRYGAVPVIGRALGFKIDQSQRSFLDVLADEHPKLKK